MSYHANLKCHKTPHLTTSKPLNPSSHDICFAPPAHTLNPITKLFLSLSIVRLLSFSTRSLVAILGEACSRRSLSWWFSGSSYKVHYLEDILVLFWIFRRIFLGPLSDFPPISRGILF
ncbi:hypothetical protein L6164_018752 [Bauhinia variegata]|uniref:Uncharacterized protein n=1 Tax=Bauhinia variegata TaxID=167791 RepID=A0ACB9NE70_BAUVA|nr:hypothetical protein L6164_018752 [Bauhinia variegata]